MKKYLAIALTAFAVMLSGNALAQESSAPAASEPAAAAAASAPAAAAPAPAASAAAAADASAPAAAPVVDKVDKGDNAWLLISSALVMLMTIPGLALFYGGLVRTKNALSLLLQCFVVFALITVLWVVYGYSLAFTEGNAVIGGFSKLFLHGVTVDSIAATFSKGVGVSELIYVAFQGAFAAITVALILGAFAERIKFSALLVFSVLWFTFSYLPICHMVWYWAGPDAFTSPEAGAAATATAGFMAQRGALDFAGGTVVHINAAISGLVGAYVIGKRIGLGKESMAPHSLTLTMIGASLLWIGWFGFNAGSALEANGTAGLAFVNTWLATATATMSWLFAEWLIKGKPSMLGAASGSLAGLVAITPAAGYVGVVGALVIGLAAGLICLWGVNGLKKLLGADDALDVFGVHGIGGITGALLTGVFAAPSLGGVGIYDYVANAVSPDYSIGSQFMVQLTGVLVTLVWSAVVSFIAYKLIDVVMGLRVPEEEEREGLDITSHGEQAYHY